jgi:polar amino acid transport system permease protein
MNSFLSPFADNGSVWLSVLLPAAGTTASLTIAAFLLAVILGGSIAALRLSSLTALRRTAQVYVEIVRGVPVLAILFLLYFGLPGYGVALNPFTAAAVGLGISSSAYIAEIIRAGLDALHKGQREAALAIGMKPLTLYRTIILPQVLRISLPALLSTLIALLKDSSLCALITVDELMLTARALSTEYFQPLQIFVLTGVIYFAIAWPLSLLARRLERRLLRGRRTVAG